MIRRFSARIRFIPVQPAKNIGKAVQHQKRKSAQDGKPSEKADDAQPVGIIGVGNQPDQRFPFRPVNQRNVSRTQHKTEEHGEQEGKKHPCQNHRTPRMTGQPLHPFDCIPRCVDRFPNISQLYTKSSVNSMDFWYVMKNAQETTRVGTLPPTQKIGTIPQPNSRNPLPGGRRKLCRFFLPQQDRCFAANHFFVFRRSQGSPDVIPSDFPDSAAPSPVPQNGRPCGSVPRRTRSLRRRIPGAECTPDPSGSPIGCRYCILRRRNRG